MGRCRFLFYIGLFIFLEQTSVCLIISVMFHLWSRGIAHIPVLIIGLLVWVNMRPVSQECAQGHTVSCVTLAMDLAQAGSTVESKIYDTLQWQVRGQLGGVRRTGGHRLLVVTLLYHPLPPQIWTLLPGFCTRPTDVATAFKGLARTLGTAISERPDLRVTVCQALRTLITKGCEAGMCELWGRGWWKVAVMV